MFGIGMTAMLVAQPIHPNLKNGKYPGFEIKVEKIGMNLFKMSHDVDNWIALIDEMQKGNILKEWAAWGIYVTCSMWIKTIFLSLTQEKR